MATKISKINRTVKITYRWWRAGDKMLNPKDQIGIKPEHVEALEESAMERIKTMMGEGCVGGQLTDNVRMTDDDPEDGIEYAGYWEIEIEDGK